MNNLVLINLQTKEVLDLDRVYTLPNNAMLKVKPELWIEWDFEKNDELGLDIWKVSKGIEKKVWWICPKCESSYDASPNNKSRGSTCSYCRGFKVNHTNSLASLNPKLAKQWHPTKNDDLTPHDVTVGSGKNVWWLGKCGHEWEDTVSHRNNRRGCPICSGRKVNHNNSLTTLNPELASQWHPTKNDDLTPNDITCGSSKKVWWIGECGHEWEATVNSRNMGVDCPYCSNNKILKGFNDMWTTNPSMASMLLNPEDGYRYTYSSHEKVDWNCPKCNEIIKDKRISYINNHGISCLKCSTTSIVMDGKINSKERYKRQ